MLESLRAIWQKGYGVRLTYRSNGFVMAEAIRDGWLDTGRVVAISTGSSESQVLESLLQALTTYELTEIVGV